MPLSYTFDPVRPFIDRPQCPNCRSRMWLDHIEPDVPDHDRRTFECPRCQHVESVVVKYN
jgi:DNA-directed RNA polymerase subunit RPC12/RpoP